MLLLLLVSFSTAEAVTNTSHCTYLRADLSSLQLLVVKCCCYDFI